MISVEFRAIQSEKFSLMNFCVNTCSLIMRLDCAFSGFKRIRLALRIFRSGILMASPVIKDLRHMIDFLRLHSFDAAENEVIILRSVIFFTKHTYLINDFFVYNKQVADIVYCTKQIRIVVRFEMRLEKLMPVH